MVRQKTNQIWTFCAKLLSDTLFVYEANPLNRLPCNHLPGATPCLAQQLSREDRAAALKIDRVVNQQMLANKIPGVSLAVLRKGKIILLKSYGLANVEHRVPVKPDTVFQSGSMGKQFTAAAVMLLVQENKLSLDDKISKYLPDVPATWKDITVWNLLTHTSGLGDYPPEIDLKRDYAEDELFASFKKARWILNPDRVGITATWVT